MATLQQLVINERPKGSESRLSVSVQPLVIQQLDALAAEANLSRSALTRCLLIDALQRHSQTAAAA